MQEFYLVSYVIDFSSAILFQIYSDNLNIQINFI